MIRAIGPIALNPSHQSHGSYPQTLTLTTRRRCSVPSSSIPRRTNPVIMLTFLHFVLLGWYLCRLPSRGRQRVTCSANGVFTAWNRLTYNFRLSSKLTIPPSTHLLKVTFNHGGTQTNLVLFPVAVFLCRWLDASDQCVSPASMAEHGYVQRACVVWLRHVLCKRTTNVWGLTALTSHRSDVSSSNNHTTRFRVRLRTRLSLRRSLRVYTRWRRARPGPAAAAPRTTTQMATKTTRATRFKLSYPRIERLLFVAHSTEIPKWSLSGPRIKVDLCVATAENR